MAVYIITGTYVYIEYSNVTRFVFGTFIGFSLSSLCLMTVERVIKIRLPEKHETWLAEGRIKYIVALSWLVQILIQVTSFFSSPLFLGFNILNSFGTLVCLVVSYVFILRSYRSSRKEILEKMKNKDKLSTDDGHENQASPSSKNDDTAEIQSIREERKLLKRVLLLLTVHFVSIFASIPALIFKVEDKIEVTTLFIVTLILSCNSTINPYLYILRVDKFKRRARKIFRKSQQRVEPQNAGTVEGKRSCRSNDLQNNNLTRN